MKSLEIKLRGHHLSCIEHYIEYSKEKSHDKKVMKDYIYAGYGKEMFYMLKEIAFTIFKKNNRIRIKVIDSLDYLCNNCPVKKKKCKEDVYNDKEYLKLYGLELGKTYSTEEIFNKIFRNVEIHS